MKELFQNQPRPVAHSQKTNLLETCFLGHCPFWEAVWLPVASTKALCQAEKHPQANLAKM